MTTDPPARDSRSLFDSWAADVRSGVRPKAYPLGAGGLAGIDFGPGRVLLIGGAPGAGKTGFVMQAVCYLLRADPSVRATVANVEMSPHGLLNRQLARYAKVPATVVRPVSSPRSNGRPSNGDSTPFGRSRTD